METINSPNRPNLALALPDWIPGMTYVRDRKGLQKNLWVPSATLLTAPGFASAKFDEFGPDSGRKTDQEDA